MQDSWARALGHHAPSPENSFPATAGRHLVTNIPPSAHPQTPRYRATSSPTSNKRRIRQRVQCALRHPQYMIHPNDHSGRSSAVRSGRCRNGELPDPTYIVQQLNQTVRHLVVWCAGIAFGHRRTSHRTLFRSYALKRHRPARGFLFFVKHSADAPYCL